MESAAWSAIPVDRRAGGGERVDVAIDGAHGDLELRGQRVGGQPSAQLQKDQDRQEPVGAHGSMQQEVLTQGVRQAKLVFAPGDSVADVADHEWRSEMSFPEIASRFVEFNGLKIHYREVGAGPALIFLNGGGPGSSGLNTFSRNMAPFADRHRVIAVDLPGYGESSKLRISEPLWGYYARVVAGFIDALGLGKAHLIGNSMGGAVSLKIALDFPEKVDRLVLASPVGGYSPFQTPPTDGVRSMVTFYLPPGPSLERLRQFLGDLVYDPASVPDEMLEERLERATDPDAAEFMPLRLGPDRPPIEELWRERLDRVPHETLIVWRREDRMNPIDQGMVLMRQIPHARFLVMPRCGHWVQWEKADDFNRAVAAFLEN